MKKNHKYKPQRFIYKDLLNQNDYNFVILNVYVKLNKLKEW